MRSFGHLLWEYTRLLREPYAETRIVNHVFGLVDAKFELDFLELHPANMSLSFGKPCGRNAQTLLKDNAASDTVATSVPLPPVVVDPDRPHIVCHYDASRS